EPFQARDVVAVLEEEQAERRLCVEMAAVGRLLEPARRHREIDWNAATEAISLAQVELGVGIALLRQRPPDRDSAGIIRALPRFDAGLHRLRRNWRTQQSGHGCGN